MIKINSAYPNPFNSSVTIGYQTSINSTINISLFDIYGRTVFNKSNIETQAGNHLFLGMAKIVWFRSSFWGLLFFYVFNAHL